MCVCACDYIYIYIYIYMHMHMHMHMHIHMHMHMHVCVCVIVCVCVYVCEFIVCWYGDVDVLTCNDPIVYSCGLVIVWWLSMYCALIVMYWCLRDPNNHSQSQSGCLSDAVV